MKILVTGSTGRVGRAIYVRLCAEHQVVGLDRAPSSTADVVAPLADTERLREALRGVDAVIHTAALHAPQVGLVSDEDFHAVNVAGTAALLRAAQEAGVRRFVFTSTTALYGAASTPPGRAGWTTEATPPQPRSIYHHTKLQAEALLEAAAGRDGLAVTVLRMSRCFPEPAPLMAAYRLHRGVDARDVADAHALALQQCEPGWRRYVVSGATPFLAEDAEALLRDAPAVITQRMPALAEAFAQRGWALPASIDRVYDPSLARRELGWQAQHGYAEVMAALDRRSSEVLPPRARWAAEE